MSELEEIPRSADFKRCYGCGEENARGLRLRFALDRAAGRVIARYAPSPDLAGYGRMAHGGVIATLLDEAMGWALWGVAQRLGVTLELRVRYHRPVFTEREVEIHGWVADRSDELATVRAELRDKRGRVLADGEGAFKFVPLERVRDAPAD